MRDDALHGDQCVDQRPPGRSSPCDVPERHGNQPHIHTESGSTALASQLCRAYTQTHGTGALPPDLVSSTFSGLDFVTSVKLCVLVCRKGGPFLLSLSLIFFSLPQPQGPRLSMSFH